MQRGRSVVNPFPESLDLNQGSLPENTSMDHSPSWNNIPNQVETRLSNYMLGATDVNTSCTNASHTTSPSFSNWDRGESSSTSNNMLDGVYGADSKTSLGLSPPSNAFPGLGRRSEDWSFPPPNTNNTSNHGNPNIQDLNSNRAPMNLNLNNAQPWSHSAIEQNPTFRASSSGLGAFSGRSTNSSENYGAAGPSFGSWGSSCKRKALDGSSSSNPPNSFYTTSGNLNISSGPVNFSPTNLVEQVNPSGGVGMSRVAPTPFPSPSVTGIPESPSRHFPIRSNYLGHESSPFDIPRTTPLRSSAAYSSHFSRPIANSDSSGLRSSIALPTNHHNSLNPNPIAGNEARGTHSCPWNGSNSQGGSSSSSFTISAQRGFAPRDEVNARTARRNNLDYPLTVSAPETRNFFPDQVDWSYAPETSASSRNHPSGSRVTPGSGSGSRTWLPHQNPTSQNHHMVSESFPWIPFNRGESEFGIGTRRGHFSHLPSASSSSDEGASSSRHRLDQRAAAFLMDIPGDDSDSWRSLAAVEGRHRLIRQVLNAMRRGVHLQAEDYMLIDPLINGFAELQDRHRDMRLDVDNMSYEELLALEEQIGDVSTGLSEEQISSSMKQHKHEGARGPNMEPCCICQESYVIGEDIGVLDCGHEFHTLCIKQWLTVKNLCPICKTTALKGNGV